MRKSYTILFTFIVLLSTAMSAQALEFKTIERHNGASAYASWTETNGDIITDNYLSVTKSNDGTDICLDIYTWDLANGIFLNEKSGYMFTKDNVFSIDKKLNSASLSEVTINVNDYNTGQIEPLTVKADWIGKGAVSTGSSRSTSKDGDYTFRSSDSSSFREASVIGSINGQILEANPYAQMSVFKSAYITTKK